MFENAEDRATNGNAPRRLTLRKGEKLRHKKLVNNLFTQGKSIYEFPIRLVWTSLSPARLEEEFRAGVPPRTDKMQMLITIPKKKRHRAVDRVLLRRRIREAYRLNRLRLLDVINERNEIGTLSLAFIYLGEENMNFDEIEKRMVNLLHKMEKKITAQDSPQTPQQI